MPTTEKTIIANERSSVGVVVTFKDEAGAALTPSAIAWTLSDADGDVVNSREQVAVAAPASTITVALSGDDLSILPGETSAARVERHLTIEATYDSTLGLGLSLRDVLVFYVNNLSYVG